MTKPDMRIMTGVRLFNRRHWRDALLLFEAVWVQTRLSEHKALVQIANCVLQLHLGLYKSPRVLIPKALELLTTEPSCTGIDIPMLVQGLHQLAKIIPVDDEHQ